RRELHDELLAHPAAAAGDHRQLALEVVHGRSPQKLEPPDGRRGPPRGYEAERHATEPVGGTVAPVSDGTPSMADWGRGTDDELARVIVISPHPDDAVLSCGRFLAAHPGVQVVTVFAGVPARYPDPPGRWTVLSGFGAGDDVVRARRAEDDDAIG